jgi:hypothetical protein
VRAFKLTLELRQDRSLFLKFGGSLTGACVVSDVNAVKDVAEAVSEYFPAMYEDALKNNRQQEQAA